MPQVCYTKRWLLQGTSLSPAQTKMAEEQAQSGPLLEKLYPYPGSAARSHVWGYFGFRKIKEGPGIKQNLDMTKAVCRLCRKEYAFKGNTTNFAFHLSSDHKEDLSTNKDPVQAVQPQKAKQTTLDDFNKSNVVKKMSESKKNAVDNALMKLLIAKVLPMSLVDNRFFKEFVNLLNSNYEVPSSKTVLHRLQSKKSLIEKTIKEEISELRDISITHDSWTSLNTESYSTVTGHYINKDWELKSVVLETKKMDGSHTAENIKSSLLETQARWGLPNPIGVTDNAANERKAFELLKWVRFGCYGHRLNLVVKSALSGPEVSKITAKGRKLVTYFHQSSSVTGMLMKKQALLLDQDKIGHKLINDVVTRWNSAYDMLARLLEQGPAIMAVITDPSLSKTAASTLKDFVFTFDDQSTVESLAALLKPFLSATSSLCADKSPTLQKVMPIIVKLNSCIAPQQNDGNVITKVKGIMRTQLESRTKDRDLALLGCMLNPASKNLEFLPSEERAYGHDILLKAALEVADVSLVKVKVEPDDTASSDATNPSSETGLPPLPSAPDGIEMVPEVGGSSESDLSITSVAKVPSEPSNHTVQKPIYCVDVLEVSPEKKRKREDTDDWFQDIMIVGESKTNITDVVHQEVARYLTSARTDTHLTLLQWWKNNGHFYPRLSLLARKYLSVPASSVPCERVFSLAGHLVNKKRARLSKDNIDLIIFLNKNMTYW